MDVCLSMEGAWEICESFQDSSVLFPKKKFEHIVHFSLLSLVDNPSWDCSLFLPLSLSLVDIAIMSYDERMKVVPGFLTSVDHE